MFDNRNPNCLAALRYAAEGFAVFPIHEPGQGASGCSCKKSNCSDQGKHPRIKGGFKAASTDESKIVALWGKYPDANIGIATGRLSNLVVIDVDDRNGGPATLEALLDREGEILPPTRTAVTGGGLHHYFRAPLEELFTASGALGTGIDLKAERGYIVAPPSRHSNGEIYEFVDPAAPIADLPEWLLHLLRKPKLVGNTRGQHRSVILEGSRNSTLASIGGKLRAQGATRDQILAEMRVVNADRCSPVLTEEEVEGIADSMVRYPVGDGRSQPVFRVSNAWDENPLWWIPFNLRWWSESISVAMMDAEQIGWYLSLLLRAWPQQGRLPCDMAALAKLARAESRTAFEAKSDLVLQEFEQRDIDDLETILVHPYLESRYVEQLKRWEQTVAAGKASAEARKRKKEEREA